MADLVDPQVGTMVLNSFTQRGIVVINVILFRQYYKSHFLGQFHAWGNTAINVRDHFNGAVVPGIKVINKPGDRVSIHDRLTNEVCPIPMAPTAKMNPSREHKRDG